LIYIYIYINRIGLTSLVDTLVFVEAPIPSKSYPCSFKALVVILDGVVIVLVDVVVADVVATAAAFNGIFTDGSEDRDNVPGPSADESGFKMAAPKKTTEVPKNPYSQHGEYE
jgi:hypothetical protein